MGYSNALPKNPYLPALVSSSRTTSRATRRISSFNTSSTPGGTSSKYQNLLPACVVFSVSKEASSRIEISAWSERPLALAMASSFARKSGSSRIEYGGGRLSVFIVSNLPMVIQSIQVIVWSTLYYHLSYAMFGITKNYLGVQNEFGTEKTSTAFSTS